MLGNVLEVKIEKSSNDNRHSEEPNIQKGRGAGRVEGGSGTLESVWSLLYFHSGVKMWDWFELGADRFSSNFNCPVQCLISR